MEEEPYIDFKNGEAPYISDTNLNQMQKLIKADIKEKQAFKYTLEITEDKTAGQEITLPCYYKVGEEVLDVYLNGERLIKSTDDTGTDGHYVEVGTADSISNKIKTTTDWNLAEGDVLDLVVRGDYSDTVS